MKLSGSEEALVDFLKESKPSTVKELVKEVGNGVKKTEVNSVLYSLLKKGVVKKTDDTPPVWSIVRKRVKYLVVIGFQWHPDWLDDAAKSVGPDLKILFFTDGLKSPRQTKVETHLVNIRSDKSFVTNVAIKLSSILTQNKDIEIVLSSTNEEWRDVLTQLDETFGVKWSMVSREWEDVRKHIE